MKKRLLILDRGGMVQYLSKEGDTVFDRAKYVIVVITSASKISQFDKAFFDEIHVWDTDNDDEGLINFAVALHAKTPFHRVIACSERLLLPAAQIREIIGCDGDRYQDIVGVRDKAVMHEIAKAQGLNVPRQWLARNYADCIASLSQGVSLVIKPRSGMGSRGIWQVNNEQGLRTVIAELVQQGTDPDTYLIETYIEGSVFHVDTVIAGGVILFQVGFEYLSSPMQFTDARPRAAIMLSNPEVSAAIYQANRQVISAFNIRDGVTHSEYFYTPEGDVVFGEVAKRVGGGAISETIYQLSGVDLNKAMAQSQLGDVISLAPNPTLQYGGWLQFHPRPMTISRLSDADDFTEDWVKFCIIKKKIGDQLHSPYMTGDTIADFAIAASNEPLLRARINSVINKFYCE